MSSYSSFPLHFLLQKCGDHKVSDKTQYPTFARTSPTATQVTYSIIALLSKFSWNKFSIIVGSQRNWNSTAEQLVVLANTFNYTINGIYEFQQPYYGRKDDPTFHDIVSRSYVDTRGEQVFLYLCTNVLCWCLINIYSIHIFSVFAIYHMDERRI